MEQIKAHTGAKKIDQPKLMIKDEFVIQWSPLPREKKIDIDAERHPEEQIVERGSSALGAYGL